MASLLIQSADGTSLNVESHGEHPSAPPLVVISGALFATQLWRASLPLLSAERRVWVWPIVRVFFCAARG